ncbi:MAG TPA: M48 family metalloprotease [Rhodanobacteraceae bacterium]|nr:M48 family metalloprotease [Rhodanobacteraceae bacterium]
MPARRLLTAMLAAGFAFGAGAQDDVRLPDLGSSAGAVLSPQEAQQYGAGMLHQMRAMDLVLDDPLVNDYINDVGYRLVAHSDNPKLKFTFFVVRDDEINAFAAPGGYIGVNSGLIDITSSESELAGVMAHEIGHITQHHLERAFEASKKDAPLMALVLLGAIAAGSGSNSGDAGMAVLAGGQGLLAQREINFTRKDETEADRVGIETLAKAGYDPNAMAGFFQRMADVLRPGAGGDDVPALLQSHPVTAERISEAKARAHTLQQTSKWAATALDSTHWQKTTAPIAFVKDPSALLAAPKAATGGLPMYPLMRERVRVLADDATRMAAWYAQNLAHGHGFDTPANRYGYALALTRSGRGGKAIGQLQPLLDKYPSSLPLRLAMAGAELDAGQRARALAIYADLHAGSPTNRAIAIAYAHALLDDGSVAAAGKAAVLLKPLLDDSDEPDIYQTYARASERAGDGARAAEAYADASYLSGRPFDAMEQLRRLLKRKDLDYYQRARVQARIAELTPIVLELHKRHVKTEDSGEQQFAPAAGESCAGRLCFGVEGH